MLLRFLKPLVRGCLLPLALSTAACGGLASAVHAVQKPMTWACAPDRVTKDYPEAQPVRLRYVEKPAYEELVFGKGLCDRLTSTAKKVVMVDFDAWGNRSRGVVGYRILAIDGEQIIRTGGFEYSSVTGTPGPHPLGEYFK